MHAAEFIPDLAVIMLIAGIVTIVFHRFKQPVVLGYIAAGVIIGPARIHRRFNWSGTPIRSRSSPNWAWSSSCSRSGWNSA